jgi:hypothetical protein
VVRIADGSKDVIRLADQSVVWKKGAQGELRLKPGDHIRARGLGGAGGAFAVTDAWVDIQSFQAKVFSAERSQFAAELSRWPGRQVAIGIQATNSTVAKQGGAW